MSRGEQEKPFWLPGTGREIRNHIPVLWEGNGNLKLHSRFSGREREWKRMEENVSVSGTEMKNLIPDLRERVILADWPFIEVCI